jgi:hypothetical protein
MLQVGDASKQFIIDTRFINPKELKEVLESVKIVGANLAFDFAMVKHHYGWELSRLYDVMLSEKIITNNQLGTDKKGFYSLANIAERRLGAEFSPVKVSKQGKIQREQGSLFPEYSFSKATRLEFINIEYKPFTKRQIIYGASDV